eukprot:TRINITY_DN3391_c0_g1_i1.p1 TRINITY_DN3391_c0_g1~~TRINITY_DN3391_c0_g1_i1.p1  ORF type:complete len:257 (-),score=56.32 TRINITY_DN3391_c0_g1_i1:471-1241(-)
MCIRDRVSTQSTGRHELTFVLQPQCHACWAAWGMSLFVPYGEHGLHEASQDPVTVKLLVVGDLGVGKTSLIQRFSDNLFRESYVSTVGIDLRVATPVVRGHKIRLELWDTAGQERFRAITTAYFRKADAISVCYRCDDRHSFDSVALWLQTIRQCCAGEVACAVMATMADLEEGRHLEVPHEDGRALAEQLGVKFWVTSAKSGLNVGEAILGLAEECCGNLEPGGQDARLEHAIDLTQSADDNEDRAPSGAKKCSC